MDYLISEEQFIPIMEMFLEDIVKPKLLNQYSEENLRDDYRTFIVSNIKLNERLDRNSHTGKLYPHFEIFCQGYIDSWMKESVGIFIKKEIEKYFDNLVISPNSSFIFVK